MLFTFDVKIYMTKIISLTFVLQMKLSSAFSWKSWTWNLALWHRWCCDVSILSITIAV